MLRCLRNNRLPWRRRKQGEVIVDNDYYLRVTRQYILQRSGTATLRLQPVGLCARGVKITARAPSGLAPAPAFRLHSFAIHTDRAGAKTGIAQHIDTA